MVLNTNFSFQGLRIKFPLHFILFFLKEQSKRERKDKKKMTTKLLDTHVSL